jgi:hypothetical protein
MTELAIGIFFGALVTAALQVGQGWLERRNHARASARILFADLVTAKTLLERARKDGSWWEEPLPLGDWRDYRDSLALATSSAEFHTVANIFWNMETMERDRGADAVLPGDPVLLDGIKMIEDAQRIVYDRGRTRWERWRERADTKDSAAEPAASG